MPRYTPSYARMCHTGPRPIVRPMSIEKAIEGARESGWEMADMVIDGYMADDPRLEAWEQQWNTEKYYRKAQGGYAPTERDLSPVLEAYEEGYRAYVEMALGEAPEWFTSERVATFTKRARRIVEEVRAA